MAQGLSHITFIVRNLERMTQIVMQVLGGRQVYDSGEETFSLSRERFFMVGDAWIAVMEGDPVRERSYNHIAFKVSDADLPRAEQAIRDLGLEVLSPRSRVEGEGQSIYFYDDDNHLLELHSGTLEQRLDRYAQGR
ncbi:MAG: FosX/FosE/FosI family fosfomycin resistance thiol transferase [Rhodospirillaceae bacterium]|mgnify:FL=1|nr:FosX/FosE/FosI family fosfomycin resistance thiol transferase [Rhodospirillaceae bacterium]|tara:strand:- start:40 stop:447 length:408 start_codon:yes stop_codon:yes gene_type:complete